MENKPSALSAAMEDYLKAIYGLHSAHGAATTNALAAALGISAASTTKMVKKLAAMKLVLHSPYRGVELTRAGEKIALQIVRHHRLIELFLHEALGLAWDQVHTEAHKLEHVLSDNLENHIADFLGDPTEDPHGDPIPTKAGKLDLSPRASLADLAAGQSATICRITDQAPEHLRHFSMLGLVPNATVSVIRREPFGGPLRVRVARRGEQVLDHALARQILVGATPARRRRKKSEESR